MSETKPPEGYDYVPGFVGLYMASRDGSIRSCDRIIQHTFGPHCKVRQRTIRGRVLRQQMHKDGYYRVCLFKNRKRHCFLSSRVIADTFLEPPTASRHQVNHKDGNKANNNIRNLEWVTPSENLKHAFAVLGRKSPRGERNHKSKLTAKKVRVIRRKWENGETYTSLGKRFSVSDNAIRAICIRKNWKHVI